jgi:hypothetical protein
VDTVPDPLLLKKIWRWVDNIKMDLAEMGLGGVDWTGWLRIGTSGELL